MSFAEKLCDVIESLNVTQKKFGEIAGINKSTLSQYLSGKIEPLDKRKQEIAKSLGFEENYFLEQSEDTVAQQLKRMNKKNTAVVERLDVTTAAGLLKMGHETLRRGLQQGVFPWGYAVHTSKNCWTYFINAKKFAEIEGIDLE